MKPTCLLLLLAATIPLMPGMAEPIPQMIGYSTQPSAYFNEHAEDVAKFYDGFFFNVGAWDTEIPTKLGLGSGAPPTTDWLERVRENLVHLRGAGVTENLLAVSFNSDALWPSAETLRNDEYTAKMKQHFAALGAAARDLGFRGVSIDVEYPYPRYELAHESYTYDDYTADDLLEGAKRQGRQLMTGLLDAFPEAVVFVLPGYLWGRPIERSFMLGMLDVMAERDAPGGFHLGLERSYCLYEGPVTQVAVARQGDLEAEVLLQDQALSYWHRRGSVAPGVWPMHMVETGGQDYPKRPWADELAELRQQIEILRTVAKRYTWSFAGQPLWYRYRPELETAYGLTKQTYEGADEAIAGWHKILADKKKTTDPRLLKLARNVELYDRQEIDGAALCSRFGTPGDWMVLGLLGNPFTHPGFSAPDAFSHPIRLSEPIHGRDGVVHWFPFRGRDPLGTVRLVAAFDWHNTNDSSAQLVTTVNATESTEALLWIGWDDGIVVRMDDRIVFNHPDYPKQGHGMLFRDRYLFEDKVAITLPQGKSRLSVVSINSHGNWGFNLRITDADGFPLDTVSFSLPDYDL